MTIFLDQAKTMIKWVENDSSNLIRLHQNELHRSLLEPSDLSSIMKDYVTRSTHFHYPPMPDASLRVAYAQYLKVAPEQILVTAGSSDAIRLVAQSLQRTGKTIAIQSPSFFAFERLFIGPGVQHLRLELNQDFEMEAATLLSPDVLKSDIVILCSPNNPTGNTIDPVVLKNFVDNYQGLLILDEAYMDFLPDRPSLAPLTSSRKNLLVLRTMSKAWGIANARVGFLVGHPDLIEYFSKFHMPYSVAGLSQTVASFLVNHRQEALKVAVEETRVRRALVVSRLERMVDVRVFPSAANFVFFACAHAVELEKWLYANHNVAIKSFILAGRGDFVRLSLTANPDTLSTVLDRIEEFLASRRIGAAAS